MFGLIEDADGIQIRPTARAQAIVAPITDAHAAKAMVDAFMAVELFKKVFDQFQGTTIPEQAGLRHLFQTQYQIVPDRIGPTVRILLESAEQAGLFKVAGNRSKMMLPLASPVVSPAAPAIPPLSPMESDAPRHGGNGGGSNGRGGSTIDPAILGLLEKLPSAGTPLTAKKRRHLIDAFTATVNFIYPDADEEPGQEENGQRRRS
jgi:hypothetical protein